MRVERLSQRAAGRSPKDFLIRHAWKLGFGLLVLGLLTARGASQPLTPHLPGHALAASGGGPTIVQCGPLPSGTTTYWNWAGSPYILPSNDPNLGPGDAAHPNCTKPDPTSLTGRKADDISVPADATLVIDASQGPVQIFSHGAGITVTGGQIQSVSLTNTDCAVPATQQNTVTFDAEPDAASWDGIKITTGTTSSSTATVKGSGLFDCTGILHAVTALQIDSGSTALTGSDTHHYGLVFANGAIGPSYFDGIDATNTPVELTGLGNGRFGTVNNIGSQGLKVTFDPLQPNYPAVIERPMHVEKVVFGSSVPFAETVCVPLQPCSAGTIGNDAIQGNLVGLPGVVIFQNSVYRAGSYGLELNGADNPTILNNTFVCNGSGSPRPIVSCIGTGLRYSAIYLNTNLNNATVGGHADLFHNITGNLGQQNGLDALVLNGTVTTSGASVDWITPTNDPSPPPAPAHPLGYMVANGDLEIVGSTLTVDAADVVKAYGGAIVIKNGTLLANSAVDANGFGSSVAKSFTSMRDNGVGIQACPSVFVQSCPDPIPSNEWTGIVLSSSSASIDNANILFPTRALDISGVPGSVVVGGKAYGAAITNSRIGPTFSDSILSVGSSIYVADTHLCRIDNATQLANGSVNSHYGQCTGPGPGDHGINVAAAGLTALRDDIHGSTNDGILGSALGGQAVDVESTTIDQAGAYGIQLASADNPTVAGNIVTASGRGTATAPTTYPAIYLNGVANANFLRSATPLGSNPLCPAGSNCIAWNTGFGNGLDAIAFHGATATTLDWISPANATAAAPLGYLLDDALTVGGDLNLNQDPHNLLEIARGSLTVSGTLTASNAVITSLKQGGDNLPSSFPAYSKLPTCGSIFESRVSNNCQKPAAGDWLGLSLNGQRPNSFTASDIRYADTGIHVAATLAPTTQTLSQTSISESATTGISSESPLSITGGQIVNTARSSGYGIWFDRGLMAIGPAIISNTGQEGILGSNVSGAAIQIQAITVDRAATYGIRLVPSAAMLDGTNLTLKGNTVTNSGGGGPSAPYPAIYLNGVTSGDFASAISGNLGSGNGIDALVFHGQLAADLTWRTARVNQPGDRLGYLLDGGLDLRGRILTVNAGDVVKVGNQGSLALDGGSLLADNTSTSQPKIFTSLADTSAGVAVCPSALVAGCGSPQTTDWAGIVVSGTGGSGPAKGDLVNAVIRYATTGLSITSQAQSSFDSSAFGFTVTRSTIGPTKLDAISASATPFSVTDSTITSAEHGIAFDFPPGLGSSSAGVRINGDRFLNTRADAIAGTRLTGHPVLINDNHIQQAHSYGVRLAAADRLILRNNNISCSGLDPAYSCTGGPPTANTYPAMFLSQLSGDFLSSIRGNVGSGNGLDAIAFDGTVTRDLRWISPYNDSATHALGFVLDGGLTFDNSNLIVDAGNVVRVLQGAITVNQGTIVTGNGAGANPVFTSFRDLSAAGLTVCPSIFVPVCTPPVKGEWGGLTINGLSQSNPQAMSVLNSTAIRYVDTGLAINVGPFAVADSAAAANFRVRVSNSTITHTVKDAITSVDTPITVDASTRIGPDIGGYGIYASFLSPANCAPSPPACARLQVINDTITGTSKDGIAATGLGGEPVIVSGNTVTNAGSYGIRLVGADRVKLSANEVDSSGAASPGYPAIYLSQVRGDFNRDISANTGTGNAVNAVAVHGVATTGLNWLGGAPNLPYILDGDLTVYGPAEIDLQTVKALNGTLTLNGALKSAGATFTSLKDNASGGPVACPSVFVQSCVPGPADWGGLQIKGGPSTVSRAVIRYAATGLLGDGGVAIDASNIQQNGTGLSLTAGDSLTNSDVLNNGAYDLVGPAGVLADADWWGSTPPAPKLSGSVAITHPLKSQRPSLASSDGGSVVVTGSNTNRNGKIGKGTITITLTFSRRMDTNSLASVSFDTNLNIAGHWSADGMQWTSDNPFPIDATNAASGNKSVHVTGAMSATSYSAAELAVTPLVTFMQDYPPSPTTDFTTDMTLPTIAPSTVSVTPGNTTQLLTGTVSPAGWPATFDFKVGNIVVPVPATPHTSSDASSVTVTASVTDSTATDVVLVAHYGNGDLTSASAASLIPTGAATHFDMTASSAAADAGTGVLETISAKDGSGAIVADYAGTLTLAVSPADLGATYRLAGSTSAPSPIGTPLSVSSTNAGSVNVVVFFSNSGNVSLTTTAPLPTGTSSSVTVSAATVTKLVVTGLVAGNAGDVRSVTVTAENAGSTTVTSYAGTVDLTDSSGQALQPAEITFVPGVSGDNGSKTVSVTLTRSGLQTLTATDIGPIAVTAGSQAVNISALAVSKLVFTTPPADVTAGLADPFTLTATDQYGNPSAYSGVVHFTSTDGQAAKPADINFNGAMSLPLSVTFKTAGSRTLTAQDTATPSITGTSPAVNVTAASTDHFVVAASTATLAAPVSANLAFTAVDRFGNPTPSYAGTVRFDSTDGQAAKPPETPFVAGTLSVTATLRTAGQWTVTATDKVTSSISGTSPAITVLPGATTQLAFSGLPAAATAGTPVAFTLTAQDAFGNPTPAYRGTVRITSSDGNAARPGDVSFKGSSVTSAMTLKTAGPQTLAALDTVSGSMISGTSSPSTIMVTAAAASGLGFSTPAQTTTAGQTSATITVQLQDAFGNPVKAGADLPLNIVSGNSVSGSFFETDATTTLASPKIANGTSSLSFVYKDTHAGPVTLTASASGVTSGSQIETVTPGAATSLSLSYSGIVVHGHAFALAVVARDAYGNTATGYIGTIHFGSSDASSPPANYTFTTGAGNDNGIHVFAVTLSAAGTPTVTATDTAAPSITGSTPVTVT